MLTIKKNYLTFIALILAFLVHISYIDNGFAWLDHNDIEQGQAVFPLNELPQVFFRQFGSTGFYRPMVTIFNSLDFALYGNWAPGFHLTSIFLHLLVVALLFPFLDVFFRFSFKEKLLVALIVGLSPVTSPVVGLTFQRQEPLLLIGIFLTLYFYSLSRINGSSKAVFFTFVFFLFALFSKETALVVISVLAVFWEITIKGKKKKGVTLGFGILSLMTFYVILRLKAVPNIWGTKAVSMPLAEYVGTRLGLIEKWVILLLNPLQPKLTDVVPIIGIFNPRAVFTLILITLALFIILRYKIKSDIGKIIGMGMIMLAPGLDIIPVPRVGSPHYAYLPLIPFAAGIALLLSNLKGSLKSIGWIVFIIWLIIGAISTFKMGFQFEDDMTLFKPEVEKDMNFYEGHYFLGNYYVMKSGDLVNAEKEFELALKEDSRVLAFRDVWATQVNLAGVKLEKGEFDEAEALYKKVEEDTPPSLKENIEYSLAMIAYDKGDYKKAVELLSGKNWSMREPYLMLEESLRLLKLKK